MNEQGAWLTPAYRNVWGIILSLLELDQSQKFGFGTISVSDNAVSWLNQYLMLQTKGQTEEKDTKRPLALVSCSKQSKVSHPFKNKLKMEQETEHESQNTEQTK